MADEPHPGERNTVLVVEDEFLTRMMLVEELTEEGFRVVEAENGDDALEYLEHNHSSIVVLFTDVQMPGSIDGIRLAHHCVTHWPQVRVLMTSARPKNAQVPLPPDTMYVDKPYSMRNVVRRLRKLLEDEATGVGDLSDDGLLE